MLDATNCWNVSSVSFKMSQKMENTVEQLHFVEIILETKFNKVT